MKPKTFTLVTGASSGLGREIAVLLSTSRNLILHGRNEKRLDETRKSCAHPDQHIAWSMNLEDVDGIAKSLGDLLAGQNAAIDCFIHSAGLLKIFPVRLMEPKLARQVMSVNFLSAAEIVRLLVKNTFNHQPLTNIVFVSSIASQFGAKGFNLYCASKGALDALMKALAVELAPNIRVNSVLPGGVQTPMSEAILADPTTKARLEADYPLGLGQPADIAAAVEFLVSEKARWITGQQLVIDGGRTVNISG